MTSNTDLKQDAYNTEYPNIYLNSYWGRFRSEPEMEIIINRNEFIKEYKIQKYALRIPQYVLKYTDRNYQGYKGMRPMDHTEYYITHDYDWIVLNSPYGDLHEDDDVLLSKLGWEKYKKMYSEHATTYILRIPGFKEKSFEPIMRKLIKQFDDPNMEEYKHEFIEDGWNYYIRKSKQSNEIYIKRFKIGKRSNIKAQFLQEESAYMCCDKVSIYSCPGCRVIDLVIPICVIIY